jgi:hypothetical protein
MNTFFDPVNVRFFNKLIPFLCHKKKYPRQRMGKDTLLEKSLVEIAVFLSENGKIYKISIGF